MVGNSILPKMSGNEWKRGLPDKALKPATMALTASEERFLSHYSEHGDRVAAVRYGVPGAMVRKCTVRVAPGTL